MAMGAAAVSSALLQHPHSHYETVDESEFEECNTLTVLHYGNRKSHWMTPQYISLQLRCSRLIIAEARQALRGHFREESYQNLQRLALQIDMKTDLAKGSSANRTLVYHDLCDLFFLVKAFLDLYLDSVRMELCWNPNYSMDQLPAFLAVPMDDREAVSGHLEESFNL